MPSANPKHSTKTGHNVTVRRTEDFVNCGNIEATEPNHGWTCVPEVKPLPPRPLHAQNDRLQGPQVISKATERRLQAATQKSTSDLQWRMEELKALLEENKRLQDELLYVQKLQSTSKRFLEEVQSISKSLRESVLKFRNDQKTIDHEFLQSTAI